MTSTSVPRSASRHEDDSRFVACSVSGGRLNPVDMPDHRHTRYVHRAEHLDATQVIVIDIDLHRGKGGMVTQPIGPQRLNGLVCRIEGTLVELIRRECVLIHYRRRAWV